MIRRLLLGLAAAGAAFASVGIGLVALAFTLYDLVLPDLGPAGSAAVVAAAAAVILAVAGLMVALLARPKRLKSPRDAGLGEKAMAFFREKPVLAISAAAAAGFLAVRNPRYLGHALRSFLEEGARRRR
ncbi:MAG: hypothetical protein ACYC8V_13500 [Caulobacteraceae bacterium]